jgi:hypothetical protein
LAGSRYEDDFQKTELEEHEGNEGHEGISKAIKNGLNG